MAKRNKGKNKHKSQTPVHKAQPREAEVVTVETVTETVTVLSADVAPTAIAQVPDVTAAETKTETVAASKEVGDEEVKERPNQFVVFTAGALIGAVLTSLLM